MIYLFNDILARVDRDTIEHNGIMQMWSCDPTGIA